ncbi:Cysteine protease atg4 [Coemansia sp. RSA 720]|nr:Cysteine protease atg4 [Coemansia sp. RSA 720]
MVFVSDVAEPRQDGELPAKVTANTSVSANEQASAHPAAESTADMVVNTLREWYVLASDSIASLLDGRFLQQPARDLWLLGKHYDLTEHTDSATAYPQHVIDDFTRLIWCTYRSQYAPIAQSQFTTDAGWGCMLRAGQTLMAQALQLHALGRDWTFSWTSSDSEQVKRRQLYTKVVGEFFDDYDPRSSFSIQRMAALGQQFEGKDIGEWFGPYGTARILRGLARQANHDVTVYTTTDGVVYLADVCAQEFRPTLILVASMLGIDRVNPVYYAFIQASLMLPQSAGIAGGRPSSALYFAGVQGDELLYLDPHTTRPAVTRTEKEYSQSDLATYSCPTPRRIAMSRLDPCMVFGYYCATLESLVDLRSRIELLADDGVTAIVSFDNGHAPESAIAGSSESSESSESSGSSGSVRASESTGSEPIDSKARADDCRVSTPVLLTKLPNDSDNDDASCNSNTGRPKSESGEIILEGECSDEEWVTDL